MVNIFVNDLITKLKIGIFILDKSDLVQMLFIFNSQSFSNAFYFTKIVR